MGDVTRSSLVVTAAVVVVGTALSAAAWRPGRETAPAPPATPVLVELFTSEGCSSCPSADALLRQLDDTQPVAGADVIVLSEHVDYWNRLGWTDPFSSALFTERQQQYVTALRAENLYTPQAVVDGAREVVGNDRPALTAAVAAAASPKAALEVRVTARVPHSLAVSVTGVVPRDHAGDVFVAVAERDLTVQVTRGENANKRLRHTGVVRRLARAGSVAKDGTVAVGAFAVDLDPAWNRSTLRVVAFTQGPKQGPVTAIGVAAVP